MIPFISVNDPMFMSTMPKEVTASSGIDVVSHSIEAYSATEASPITDALALGALETAFRFLPRAYENGNDMEAREKICRYAGDLDVSCVMNGGSISFLPRESNLSRLFSFLVDFRAGEEDNIIK